MPDLAGPKTIYFGFTGYIEPAGVSRIAAAFNMAINQNNDEVCLCFSSLGGTIADGIYLYNHIRALPIKTTIYNIGSVSSIAVVVFVAAEQRYCSSHAMFMVHPTTMPSNENMAWHRLKGALDSALADDQRTENILRERTKIPPELLQNRRFHDVHIIPEKALEFGLVHGVRDFSLPKGNQIIQI